MPRLAPLLLPLAAGALGYAAGGGWWPRVAIRRGITGRWVACLSVFGIVGWQHSPTLRTALTGALADWWRGARSAACHD